MEYIKEAGAKNLNDSERRTVKRLAREILRGNVVQIYCTVGSFDLCLEKISENRVGIYRMRERFVETEKRIREMSKRSRR